MFDMFGKINEIKSQMESVQAELKELELHTNEEGISITITADKEVRKVEVSPELLQNPEALNQALPKAMNRAISDAETVAKNKMMEVTKGMMPPGLDGMQ